VFDFVLQDAGLDAASTLFIDDSFNNIDGAKKAGLLTKLLLPGETIEETLG
jgi:HAD superfamily hydrolase (TIGR01509 family)